MIKMRWLLSLVFGLALASQGFGQIAYDTVSTSGHKAKETTTYNWNHTVTGANTAIVCTVSIYSATGAGWPYTNTFVSSITYNGVALSFIALQWGALTGDTGTQTELWGLLGPATGVNAVEVTLSQAGTSGKGTQVYCTSYTGVAQVGGFEANGKNRVAVTLPITVTTVTANAWIVTGVLSESRACTVDVGTKQGGAADWAEPNINIGDYGPIAVPAATVVTWTDPTSEIFIGVGVALKPAGGATKRRVVISD